MKKLQTNILVNIICNICNKFWCGDFPSDPNLPSKCFYVSNKK